MRTFTKSVAIIVTLLVGLSVSAVGFHPPAAGPTAETGDRPTVVIDTPGHDALIQWGLERFQQAGLALPDVVIGIYDDRSVCGDAHGLHSGGRIWVCALHTNPDVQDEWRRHTLLHELAHAWADHALSGTDRQRFATMRGVPTWEDVGVRWAYRAAEHAAEIVVWAIAGYPAAPSFQFTDRSDAGLRSAYLVLTGNEPPHGYWSQDSEVCSLACAGAATRAAVGSAPPGR